MGQYVFNPMTRNYDYIPDSWERVGDRPNPPNNPAGGPGPITLHNEDFDRRNTSRFPLAPGGALGPPLGLAPTPTPTPGPGEVAPGVPVADVPAAPPSPALSPGPMPMSEMPGGGTSAGVPYGMSGTEEIDALRRASAPAPAMPPLGGGPGQGGAISGYGMSGTEEMDMLGRAGSPMSGLDQGGLASVPGQGGYTSGYGMSGTEEMDAQQRAAGGGRAGGGAGGSDNFLLGEGVGPVLYADPHSGMRRSLRGSGVNPDNNPFAQAALARFSVPVMQALYDFWEVLTGSAGDQAEGMGQFMQEFMAGRINPTALIQQAQAKMGNAETGDENLREMIAGLGAEDFTALQERARGSTPRVAQARGRVMARKAGRQREDMLSDPTNADATDWLKLIGG